MKEREKIIIVGNGAREHAVGWCINQSPNSPKLFFAPGNAGTMQIGRNLDIGVTDTDKVIGIAKDNNAFIFVGPEAPLEKGIVNAARESNVMIFGPTKEAARLETSKSWAIDFMKRNNIPHPESVVVADSNVAMRFFDKPIWSDVVIKADGLAAGKGVFLPNSKEEALTAIKRIMVNHEFDDGSKVIIQKRLKGKEMSLIVFTDGRTIAPLLPAQDYKRINDSSESLNTGGMGAFAPAPMSAELYKEIYSKILRATVDGMREEGKLLQGSLYAGLMLTDDGPKVLEYNVRLGDPETQPLLMLLNSDLLQALKNTAEGKLKRSDLVFNKGAAVCVVLAAEGYPGNPKKGDIIYGLDKIMNSDVQIFYAGTKRENGNTVTNGGRVLGLCARGRNIHDARRKIYPLIGEGDIHFRGMHYRKIIGL
jgi:phosphoribosylamine---glycine ligase